MARVVKMLRGRAIDMRLHARGSAYTPPLEDVALLKKKGITAIIVTDISVDHEPAFINEAAKFARVLIIDHHKHYSDFVQENVVLAKPQLLNSPVDPSKYCASKFCYDLMSEIADVSSMDWLAAVGSIADVATSPWQDWLASVLARHGDEVKEDLFSTKLGRVAVTINSALMHGSRNIAVAFRTVCNASSPQDVLSSGLSRFKHAVDADITKWLGLFAKAEQLPGKEAVLFTIKPRYPISSTLSTLLSFKYPHKTIIIMRPEKGMLHVSARRADRKIAVNALLEKAVRGIPDASAGGHVPAAGGRLPLKHAALFRKQLVDAL
jgi:single-stranded DNA-specific DHH superfamily exonuclease